MNWWKGSDRVKETTGTPAAINRKYCSNRKNNLTAKKKATEKTKLKKRKVKYGHIPVIKTPFRRWRAFRANRESTFRYDNIRSHLRYYPIILCSMPEIHLLPVMGEFPSASRLGPEAWYYFLLVNHFSYKYVLLRCRFFPIFPIPQIVIVASISRFRKTKTSNTDNQLQLSKHKLLNENRSVLNNLITIDEAWST